MEAPLLVPQQLNLKIIKKHIIYYIEMEQIFKNYLINKTHDKETNAIGITTPKIDVKKKIMIVLLKLLTIVTINQLLQNE